MPSVAVLDSGRGRRDRVGSAEPELVGLLVDEDGGSMPRVAKAILSPARAERLECMCSRVVGTFSPAVNRALGRTMICDGASI